MGVQSKIQNERALVGKMWDSTKISFALVRNEVLGQKKEYEDSSFTGLNSVLHPQREKGLHTKAY